MCDPCVLYCHRWLFPLPLSELPRCKAAGVLPKVYAMANSAHAPLFRLVDMFLTSKDTDALDQQLLALASNRRGSVNDVDVSGIAGVRAKAAIPAEDIPEVHKTIDYALIDDIVSSGWVPTSEESSVRELLYAYSRWQKLGDNMKSGDAAQWATRRLHLTGAALQVWESSKDTEDLCDTLVRIIRSSPSAVAPPSAATTGGDATAVLLSANQKAVLRDAAKALGLSATQKSELERLIRQNNENLLAAAEVCGGVAVPSSLSLGSCG